MHTKTKLKKLIVAGFVLMALLMSITIFLPVNNHAYAITATTPTGAGTSASPYVVTTEGELEYISNQVNSGNNSIHIKLGSNVAITGTLTPIGTAAYPFTGTFDGDNKTISGLTLTSSTRGTALGLFGFAGGSETTTVLKNIKFANVNITNTANTNTLTSIANVNLATSYTGSSASGSLAAIIGANTLIENCHLLSGTVTSNYDAAGGLIGRYANTNITTSKLDIRACSTSTGVIVRAQLSGGIIGSVFDNTSTGTADVNILDNTNNAVVGAVSSGCIQHIGGIVGHNLYLGSNDLTLNVNSNFNYGTVLAKGANYISATVLSYHSGIGGMVGYWGFAANSAVVTIENCFNRGDVTIESTVNAASLGGIIGHAYSYSLAPQLFPDKNTSSIDFNITNCENGKPDGTSIIGLDPIGSTNTTFFGGIGGAFAFGAANTNLTVNSCNNFAKISGYSNIGGIVGYLFSPSVATITSVFKIVNCYNIGTIKGYSATGGIIGYNIYGTYNDAYPFANVDKRVIIDNCHNAGLIAPLSGAGSGHGGIIGLNGAGFTSTSTDAAGKSIYVYSRITNCTNSGNVNGVGGMWSGGILGNQSFTMSITELISSNKDDFLLETEILNNVNVGNIYSNGGRHTGGITGEFTHYGGTSGITTRNGNSVARIINNLNTGNIFSSAYSSGGISPIIISYDHGPASYYDLTFSKNISLAESVVSTTSSSDGGSGGLIANFGSTGNSINSTDGNAEQKIFFRFSNNYVTTKEIVCKADTTIQAGLIGRIYIPWNTSTPNPKSKVVTLENNYSAYEGPFIGFANMAIIKNCGQMTDSQMRGVNALTNMPGLMDEGVFTTHPTETPQYVAANNMPQTFNIGADKYNVSLNANGGAADWNVTEVSYGTTLALPVPYRSGYTFLGWFTNSGVRYNQSSTFLGPDMHSATGRSPGLVNNTLTLTAKWVLRETVVSYVTLDTQGGTLATSNIAMLESGKPADLTGYVPKKTGYTFGGWYDENNKQYTNSDGSSANIWDKSVSTTLIAKWSAVTYTLTFNKNNASATGTMANMTNLSFGQAVTLNNVGYTLSGSTLRGWTLDAAGLGTLYANASVIPAGAIGSTGGTVTLYAQWTKQYVIYYNANLPVDVNYELIEGATSMDFYLNGNQYKIKPNIITVIYDEEEENPVIYTFGYWNTQADGTGDSYKAYDDLFSFNYAGNEINLYAIWIDATLTYTINYDANTGTVSPTAAQKTASQGSKFPALPTPTKTNFTFAGWFYNGVRYGIANVSDVYIFNHDITLTARWSKSMTMNANSGTGGATAFTAYFGETLGETFSKLSLPTKEGWIFDGWRLTNALTGDILTSESIFTLSAATVTAYASWKTSVTLDYNGATNTNGGTTSIDIYYGATLPALPAPTKTDYTFAGWRSGTTIYTAGNAYNGGSTLYARWISDNDITISNGANSTSGKFYYNESLQTAITASILTLPAFTNADKPNADASYTMSGFKYNSAIINLNDAFAPTVTSGIILTTLWANTVTLNYNGVVVSSAPTLITYYYGEQLINLPAPSKTGFTFDGWYYNNTKVTSITTFSPTLNAPVFVARWLVEITYRECKKGSVIYYIYNNEMIF